VGAVDHPLTIHPLLDILHAPGADRVASSDPGPPAPRIVNATPLRTSRQPADGSPSIDTTDGCVASAVRPTAPPQPTAAATAHATRETMPMDVSLIGDLKRFTTAR